MFGTETAHEGLPQAEDYRPEEIGNAHIEAGDPVQVWEEYGLEMVPLMHDGKDTGRRFIRRNGQYIADVSGDYKLLPNERVVEVANEVARDLGARPFHEFDGDWFVELDDHVYQDPDRTRVHALYAWEEGSVGGDEMEYGFAVHNSIDSSLAFSVALFSFRHACANMVHIGTGGFRDLMAQNVESERAVLTESSHKHTSGLDIEVEPLTALVKGNLSLVNHVDETYNQWQQDVVTPDLVEDVLGRNFPAKTLPDWMAETEDTLDEIKENRREFEGQEVVLPSELRAEVIEANIPTGEMVWDTYNDLTETIWHSSSTSDSTKQGRMDSLHRALPPIQRNG